MTVNSTAKKLLDATEFHDIKLIIIVNAKTNKNCRVNLYHLIYPYYQTKTDKTKEYQIECDGIVVRRAVRPPELRTKRPKEGQLYSSVNLKNKRRKPEEEAHVVSKQ